MKAIICVFLLLCVMLTITSASPAEDVPAVESNQPAIAISDGAEDDILEGAEQRWGGGGFGRGGGGFGRGGGGFGRGGGGFGRGGGGRGWGR